MYILQNNITYHISVAVSIFDSTSFFSNNLLPKYTKLTQIDRQINKINSYNLNVSRFVAFTATGLTFRNLAYLRAVNFQ